MAITGISQILTSRGLPDAYAKVLPIPVANLLSPALDRLGAGLTRGWSAAMGRPHVAHLLLLPASGWLERLHPALGWLAVAAALTAAWRLWRGERENFRPWSAPLHPRYNRAHLLAWIALTYLGVQEFKADNFPVFEHFNRHTPGLVLHDGFFARCEDNPAFCQPFRFWEEPGLSPAAP